MDYDINLKHLSYFITTARLGSINRAAQTLYIFQPHLGKIIKELERTAGAMLFERTRGGVILTPDGKDFLERAEGTLRAAQSLLEFRSASSPSAHSLMVSMTRFPTLWNVSSKLFCATKTTTPLYTGFGKARRMK